MLNMHIPTIENYSEEHAIWYRGFSTAFNLSQLSNYCLLSYLSTQVSQNEYILRRQKEYAEGLAFCRNEEDENDLLCSIDIIDMLNQICLEFAQTGEAHNRILLERGLHLEGYHDNNVKINLQEIRNSTTEKSWNKVIRGLVNVFEFLYLFSVTEDHLKEIVKDGNSRAVVGKAMKDKPGIIEHFETQFKMPRNFILKLWEFYVEVRNLYAHSFGYINKEDEKRLKAARDAFIVAYDKLPIEWTLLDYHVMDDFFSDEKIVVGKMYIISVGETCIFKNFVRMFVPELSKWEKRESLK